MIVELCAFFFFQAEDGIRYLVRSRGLGDVYKRQLYFVPLGLFITAYFSGVKVKIVRDLIGMRLRKVPPVLIVRNMITVTKAGLTVDQAKLEACLLYTSDAADERSSVDLGGRRIIKKKKKEDIQERQHTSTIKHTNNTHNHSSDAINI